MHYYKRNIGDYAKKAGRLSMLEHGAYTLLLDACYDRERFPTLDEAIEWTWARTEAEIDAVKFVLSRFFTLEDGRYVQARIAEEVAKYHGTASTNARIATEREAKRKQAARSVHEASPDDHEAPPNQEPLTTNQEPRTNTDKPSAPARATRKPSELVVSIDDLVAEGVDRQHAADWLIVRKGKGAKKLTVTAWIAVKAEAEKAGITPAEAVKTAAENTWQGFKAAWMDRAVSVPPGQAVNRQEALEARNRAVGDAWLLEQGVEA